MSLTLSKEAGTTRRPRNGRWGAGLNGGWQLERGAGGWMTLARIARCNPFGTHGLDFVPAAVPRDARWYLPWRYGRWHGTNEVPPR